MDKYRRLADLLKGRNETKETFFTATFVSSQGDTCTINVDGLELDGVRLKPTTAQTENKVLLTPAEGSDVLVGSFSGDFSNLFVLSADVVDTIEITCNGQNVMELVSQLIQTLAKAQVITPLGNGTFDPGVISQLNMIETSFKQIFK
ncbi:hypothetical protein [Dysgonomonas reticulitermitis]